MQEIKSRLALTLCSIPLCHGLVSIGYREKKTRSYPIISYIYDFEKDQMYAACACGAKHMISVVLSCI